MKDNKWTVFCDMSSGGGQKLEWRKIFIEAPEKEARNIFYNRFDRYPDHVTCDCCGSDYSVNELDNLDDVMRWASVGAHYVHSVDIKDDERKYFCDCCGSDYPE